MAMSLVSDLCTSRSWRGSNPSPGIEAEKVQTEVKSTTATTRQRDTDEYQNVFPLPVSETFNRERVCCLRSCSNCNSSSFRCPDLETQSVQLPNEPYAVDGGQYPNLSTPTAVPHPEYPNSQRATPNEYKRGQDLPPDADGVGFSTVEDGGPSQASGHRQSGFYDPSRSRLDRGETVTSGNQTRNGFPTEDRADPSPNRCSKDARGSTPGEKSEVGSAGIPYLYQASKAFVRSGDTDGAAPKRNAAQDVSTAAETIVSKQAKDTKDDRDQQRNKEASQPRTDMADWNRGEQKSTSVSVPETKSKLRELLEDHDPETTVTESSSFPLRQDTSDAGKRLKPTVPELGTAENELEDRTSEYQGCCDGGESVCVAGDEFVPIEDDDDDDASGVKRFLTVDGDVGDPQANVDMKRIRSDINAQTDKPTTSPYFADSPTPVSTSEVLPPCPIDLLTHISSNFFTNYEVFDKEEEEEEEEEEEHPNMAGEVLPDSNRSSGDGSVYCHMAPASPGCVASSVEREQHFEDVYTAQPIYLQRNSTRISDYGPLSTDIKLSPATKAGRGGTPYQQSLCMNLDEGSMKMRYREAIFKFSKLTNLLTLKRRSKILVDSKIYRLKRQLVQLKTAMLLERRLLQARDKDVQCLAVSKPGGGRTSRDSHTDTQQRNGEAVRLPLVLPSENGTSSTVRQSETLRLPLILPSESGTTSDVRQGGGTTYTTSSRVVRTSTRTNYDDVDDLSRSVLVVEYPGNSSDRLENRPTGTVFDNNECVLDFSYPKTANINKIPEQETQRTYTHCRQEQEENGLLVNGTQDISYFHNPDASTCNDSTRHVANPAQRVGLPHLPIAHYAVPPSSEYCALCPPPIANHKYRTPNFTVNDIMMGGESLSSPGLIPGLKPIEQPLIAAREDQQSRPNEFTTFNPTLLNGYNNTSPVNSVSLITGSTAAASSSLATHSGDSGNFSRKDSSAVAFKAPTYVDLRLRKRRVRESQLSNHQPDPNLYKTHAEKPILNNDSFREPPFEKILKTQDMLGNASITPQGNPCYPSVKFNTRYMCRLGLLDRLLPKGMTHELEDRRFVRELNVPVPFNFPLNLPRPYDPQLRGLHLAPGYSSNCVDFRGLISPTFPGEEFVDPSQSQILQSVPPHWSSILYPSPMRRYGEPGLFLHSPDGLHHSRGSVRHGDGGAAVLSPKGIPSLYRLPA